MNGESKNCAGHDGGPASYLPGVVRDRSPEEEKEGAKLELPGEVPKSTLG